MKKYIFSFFLISMLNFSLMGMMTKRGIEIMEAQESQKEATSELQGQKPKSRTIKWGAKPPTQAGKITTLISAEGDRFPIAEGPLSYLGTVQMLRAGPFQEKATTEISFKEIPSSLLKEITTILKVAWTNRNLKGFEFLNAIDKKVKINDPMALLQAADFLDSNILKSLIAHKVLEDIIQSIPIHKSILTKGTSFNSTTFETIIPEVMKQFYFKIFKLRIEPSLSKGEIPPQNRYKLFNEIKQIMNNLGYLDNVEYSPEHLRLLIQDYMYYAPKALRIDKYTNFGNLLLTSLEGLDNISGTEKINRLRLSTNFIRTIPAKAFSHLPNLEYLELQFNYITDIDQEAFYNLNKLIHLNLISNFKLTTLPNGVFQYTPSLKDINLKFTSLEKLDSSIFNGLKFLEKVTLPSSVSGYIPKLREQFPNITFISGFSS